MSKIRPELEQRINKEYIKFREQYDEISNKMNIPIGTVRSRLHRARETLLRIFNNKKYE